MASIINAATSGGLISTADTSGILQLQTASTTAVTVNASQNVGIGTSSPSYKLDVVAASSSAIPARLKGNASGNNNTQLRFAGNNSGTDLWAVGTEVSTSSTGTAFDFYDLTASANRMRLDSAGNLGLGVTPSAWNTSYKALQVGASAVLWSTGTGGARLGVNYFLNSADSLRYISSNFATDYRQSNGEHQFFTAPSGTAGNAITFTQAMTLNASGGLGIGETSIASDTRLHLKHTTDNCLLKIQSSFGSIIRLTNGGGSEVSTIDATGNNVLTFQTGSTERARIDTSGSLLVGTTTVPTTGGLARGIVSVKQLNDSTQTSGIQIEANANTNVLGLGYNGSTFAIGATYRSTGSYVPVSFWTGGSERARIDSSGNLLINSTSTLNAVFSVTATGGISACSLRVATDGDYGYTFKNASNTFVGAIGVNASTTSYVTSSDYRLKENIAPMTGALATVAQLKPCTYTWKVDGADGQGFIAHELAEVFPDAVTGAKDAVDEDGNIKSQGIDTSFLVATLTAAIQEQQAIIQQLQADVAALIG